MSNDILTSQPFENPRVIELIDKHYVLEQMLLNVVQLLESSSTLTSSAYSSMRSQYYDLLGGISNNTSKLCITGRGINAYHRWLVDQSFIPREGIDIPMLIKQSDVYAEKPLNVLMKLVDSYFENKLSLASFKIDAGIQSDYLTHTNRGYSSGQKPTLKFEVSSVPTFKTEGDDVLANRMRIQCLTESHHNYNRCTMEVYVPLEDMWVGTDHLNYLHVDDVVSMFYKVLESLGIEKAAPQEPRDFLKAVLAYPLDELLGQPIMVSGNPKDDAYSESTYFIQALPAYYNSGPARPIDPETRSIIFKCGQYRYRMMWSDQTINFEILKVPEYVHHSTGYYEWKNMDDVQRLHFQKYVLERLNALAAEAVTL